MRHCAGIKAEPLVLLPKAMRRYPNRGYTRMACVCRAITASSSVGITHASTWLPGALIRVIPAAALAALSKARPIQDNPALTLARTARTVFANAGSEHDAV